MMIAVVWLGVIGGGDTQLAAFSAIVITAVWMVIGFGYYFYNSKSKQSGIFPFPGKEMTNEEKHSINAT
jgi:hypothetical protein